MYAHVHVYVFTHTPTHIHTDTCHMRERDLLYRQKRPTGWEDSTRAQTHQHVGARNDGLCGEGLGRDTNEKEFAKVGCR
jgi:hypothetical protein